jgi:peptide chain release factor 2
VWNAPERAQALGQERAQLEQIVIVLDELSTGLNDAGELLSMAVEEDDADTVAEVEQDIGRFEQKLAALEFRRMFSGEMDANNAYVDIQDRKSTRLNSSH